MQQEQEKYDLAMTLSSCLWLGLFPLLQFGSFHTITRDKWVCMLLLAALTAAGFLADLLLRRLSRPRLLPCLFGAGLLLWTVLSCLLSPYPGAPWWLGTGRLEGLASRLVYLGLFFLFLLIKLKKNCIRLLMVIKNRLLCIFLPRIKAYKKELCHAALLVVAV